MDRFTKRTINGMQVDGWDVIAGRHRLAAVADVLRWDEIPTVIYQATIFTANF